MNESRILVEAAVESVEGALAAERAGVDRIELCADLSVGGTTPSLALIDTVRARTRIPVHVMIRPRGGSFVYSAAEINLIVRDIESLAMKAAGIVTGALSQEGRINVAHMRQLLDAARKLPVTFHRAFDAIGDQSEALEQLVELGVSRILTSGGASSAIESVDRIAALVEQAGDRITVIACGGVRGHNVREVLARTRAREVHARLVDEAQMRTLVDAATSRR